MTERNQTEQSRAQLQKMLDQSPAIIATVDQEWHFSTVNTAVENILGFVPEELVGKNISDFVFDKDIESTLNILTKVKQSTEVHAFENRHVHKDSRIVPLEWSARWNDKDKLLYVVGRDATDVKKAERKLERERNIYRAIIDNLPDYIFVKNRDKELVVSNERVYKDIVGVEKEEESLGKTANDLFDPEIAIPINQDDKHVIETAESIINREEMVYDDRGTKLYLKTTKVPLRDDEAVVGLIGIAHDITEQKRANDQARLEKERYDMVVQATNDAIYDWDIESNHLHWDESFRTTFGYNEKRDKYTIEQWAKNVHPDDLEEIQKSLYDTINDSSQTKWEAEYRFSTKDGTYANILERGYIIRDESGKATRMIGALQDITDLKEKERALTESLKEKKILLSEIHHRVKNNLAVVSGMMQLQAFEEEDEQLRAKILDSVTRIKSMATIHEQFYQSSSFSELNFSENLKELVKSVVQTITVGSDVSLSFNVESVQLNVNQAIPCSLIVNEVVTNILKHGFTKTEKGEVTFNLSKINDEITLQVKDNGDGLPDNFDSQKSDSLGIHLIQKLSQQLNADYKYESLNNEVVFTLTFQKSEVKGIGSTQI